MLRRDRQEHAGLIEALRQSRLSALLQQEVEQMIQDVGQTWEQELLARGQAHGEALGEARGELRAYRHLVEMLLRQRFGELPTDVVQRLSQADLTALQRAFATAATVATLQDAPL